jgi:excisionase family DNA binding protein
MTNTRRELRRERGMTELEMVLRLANELQPQELPHFLGILEEARQIARLRLMPATPAPYPPDALLTVKQAAERLQCSRDYLYKTALPFKRKLGRKLLFSSREIDEYLGRQQ